MGHRSALAEALPSGQARPHSRDTERLPPEDGLLVQALRAREPEALEELRAQYGHMILYWARSEGADAEDVLQDVMMRVWRSCHRLDPNSNLPAWLKVITKNVLRNRWKSQGRKPEILTGLEPTERESVDPTAQARSRIAVDQLLESLQDRERDALRLLYLSDLSLREVAQRLEISEDATKSLAARARRRLRTNLERLVASSPASTMYLLVGRAAEAATGMLKPLGSLGAAAAATAAATAITAGSVAVQRELEPPPAPAVFAAAPASAEAPEHLFVPAAQPATYRADPSWTPVDAGESPASPEQQTSEGGKANSRPNGSNPGQGHGPGGNPGQGDPGNNPGQGHGNNPGHGPGGNPGQGDPGNNPGQGQGNSEHTHRNPGSGSQDARGRANANGHGSRCERTDSSTGQRTNECEAGNSSAPERGPNRSAAAQGTDGGGPPQQAGRGSSERSQKGNASRPQ